jgi:hypothetical protein
MAMTVYGMVVLESLNELGMGTLRDVDKDCEGRIRRGRHSKETSIWLPIISYVLMESTAY